jgi:hypothetical protein
VRVAFAVELLYNRIMRSALVRLAVPLIRLLGVLVGLYVCCMGQVLLSANFARRPGGDAVACGVVYLFLGALLALPWRWIRVRQLWWPLFVGMAVFAACPVLLLLALIVWQVFWPSMAPEFWWPFVVLLALALFMTAQTWAVWRLRSRGLNGPISGCVQGVAM